LAGDVEPVEADHEDADVRRDVEADPALADAAAPLEGLAREALRRVGRRLVAAVAQLATQLAVNAPKKRAPPANKPKP